MAKTTLGESIVVKATLIEIGDIGWQEHAGGSIEHDGPRARFSVEDGRDFTVSLTEEQAKAIACHLYTEVSIIVGFGAKVEVES